MTIHIDERGPYVLGLVSNADARRNNSKWPYYWAGNLLVSSDGGHAYAEVTYLDSHVDCIFFFPHKGEGEPRPQQLAQPHTREAQGG